MLRIVAGSLREKATATAPTTSSRVFAILLLGAGLLSIAREFLVEPNRTRHGFTSFASNLIRHAADTTLRRTKPDEVFGLLDQTPLQKVVVLPIEVVLRFHR